MPKKRRKARKKSRRKKSKAETIDREEKNKNLATKLLELLKPTPKMLVGGIIGAVISLLFLAYINPIILPLIAPKPELDIKVFQSHASYANGTDVWGIIWDSRYAEFIVMIQLKAESPPIEDVYLVFDFDAAILTVHEERIEGVTNPSIKIGGGLLVVGDGEIITDVKYTELIVDLERLKLGGLCAFAVVIDPEYEGNIARLHIVPNPTSRYFGSYKYDTYGIKVGKSVSGNIPRPRENES